MHFHQVYVLLVGQTRPFPIAQLALMTLESVLMCVLRAMKAPIIKVELVHLVTLIARPALLQPLIVKVVSTVHMHYQVVFVSFVIQQCLTAQIVSL